MFIERLERKDEASGPFITFLVRFLASMDLLEHVLGVYMRSIDIVNIFIQSFPQARFVLFVSHIGCLG